MFAYYFSPHSHISLQVLKSSQNRFLRLILTRCNISWHHSSLHKPLIEYSKPKPINTKRKKTDIIFFYFLVPTTSIYMPI